MKTVLLTLLLLCGLVTHVFPQNKSNTVHEPAASNTAPTASYVPLVGQQLVFETVAYDTATLTSAASLETVTIKSIKPDKIIVQVKITIGDRVLEESQEEDGTPTSTPVFRAILKVLSPPLKVTTIDNCKFNYYEVTINNVLYWLVTDDTGKQAMFPGMLKKVRHHKDRWFITTKLLKIVNPCARCGKHRGNRNPKCSEHRK